jgi:hypothetical protein
MTTTTVINNNEVTKYVELTNEKGNVSAKARNEVKAQFVKALMKDGYKVSPNGCMYKQIATDFKTKQPIYAKIEPTITMDDLTVEKPKKPSTRKSTTKEVDVPQLF